MISQAPDYRKLATYFQETFEPTKLAHVAEATRRNWRKAVRAFLRFTSPAVTIGELNQETLEEFDEWLCDRKMHLQVVAYYGGSVRKVLHAADPARFKTRAMAPLGFIPENSREEGTLFWFFEHVYIPSRLGGVKESSLGHIRCVLRALDRWAGRSVLVAELSDELVTGFLNWFVGRRAPATIKGMRGVLLTLWNLAWRRKLLRRLPRVENIRLARRAPECWAPEELNRLVLASRDTAGWVDVVPAGLWWYLLQHLAYYTGLRIKAILGLRWEHLSGNTLRVPAELMKNNCEKVFELHPETLAAIEQRRKHAGGQLLLPWPSTKRMLYAAYRKILKRAGLPDGRRDMFHRLRRTSATYLAAQVGIPLASQHLGHSTHQVTTLYIDQGKLRTLRTADILPKLGVAAPAPVEVLDPVAKMLANPAELTLDEIRFVLGALQMSESEFSVRAGIYHPHLSRVLLGRCKLTHKMHGRLVLALGLLLNGAPTTGGFSNGTT